MILLDKLRIFRPVSAFPVPQPGRRDMFLFILVLILTFYGLLVLYPASSVLALIEKGDPHYYIKRQLLWLPAGLMAFFFFAFIPLKLLRKLALPGMIVAFFIVLLVFVPGLGQSVQSSRGEFQRWVAFGPFNFQPSEFAKIAIVVYAAAVLSKNDQIGIDLQIKRLTFPGVLIGFTLFAIFSGPQYGTTISLLVLIGVMLFISGFPMLRLLLVGLAFLPLLLALIFFWEYRLDRFRVWLDPYAYRFSGGYQLVTSFRAIREGGIFGEPLASGFAHRFLTYGHTDFILALLAEDFGLVGVIFLFLLYILFMIRAIQCLRTVSEPFAFLVGSGALVMLVIQAILNAGVVTGLFPTTGVGMPLVSYGGSAFVAMLSLCGLIINTGKGVS